MREYITPNWHAVMVHLPLGLLSMGVLVEVFCFILCRKSSLKLAGRWMILLGAIASVPALTTGIYAYRDVLNPNTDGVPSFSDTWAETLDSTLPGRVPPNVGKDIKVKDFLASAPGKALYDHLLYNSIATGVIFGVIVIYLACSNKWRKYLYIPLLLLLLGSKGLLIYGSHHGGIAVYQYGAAIEPPDEKVSTKPLTVQEKAQQYMPPVQVHVALAGMILSMSLVAFALSIRAITQGKPDVGDEWYKSNPPATSTKTATAPVSGSNTASTHTASVAPAPTFTPHLHATSSQGHGTIPVSQAAYPAHVKTIEVHTHDTPYVGVSRYWLLAAAFALLTLVSGLWIINTWTWKGLMDVVKSDTEIRNRYHTVLGVTILSLALILALVTKIARHSKWIVSFISLLLVGALSLQFYVGIVLLFDGPKPTVKASGFFNTLKLGQPVEKAAKEKDKD